MIENLMTYFSITPQVIVNEAKNLGFKYEILSENKNFYVIRGNGKEVYFKSNDCFLNTSLGFKIAYDKELSNIILDRSGFRIPKSIYLNKANKDSFDLENLKLEFPFVTKPIDGSSGKGVCVKLENIEELKKGIEESFKYSDDIVIQEYIPGDEHRIVVIGDKVVYCIRRVPAHVIGNGKNTIKELIEEENKNPHRGDGYNSSLVLIKIDENLKDYISKKGFTLDSVPASGEHVQLVGVSNIGKGGVPVVMTEKVGKELEKECVKLAKTVGLTVVGIDVITTDLGKSLKESKGAIIEFNADPGFGPGTIGNSNILAKELLKYVFELD